jgi:hypothetical protein
MDVFGRILLGFFVGALCGLIPLIYGLLTKHMLSAIGGIIASAFTGALFSYLNKSPFTAMVTAALFILINIASRKRHKTSSENDFNDDNDIT